MFFVIIATTLLVMGDVFGDLFDSNGRLPQVEYANNAVRNGGMSVSVRSEDFVVHVTYNQRSNSALSLNSFPRKVYAPQPN